MIAPVCVWPASSSFLASPKSVILGVPSAASSTLAGLRSRWMTLAWWAACIAPASCSTSRAACSGGKGEPASFLSRLPPGQNSSEKKGSPSWSPTSKTWTMFGCCKRATASASVRNRCRSSLRAWPPASTILRATSRSSLVWRARKTTPMPPRPSSLRLS